jgi:putative multiple sugar transport system substrate-binding protein
MEENMSKKIWILISMLLIATMVLAACTSTTTETPAEPMADEPTAAPVVEEMTGGSVGIVLPTKNEPRWLQDEARFQEALTAAGYDVEILFSEGDSAKEKANVEALISKGIKVLVLTPQDGTAAAAAAEAARDAGVKVIAYDRLILNTDAVDYYVTFDSIAVGEAQAQYLVDKATGTGNPLYLYAGAASDNNAFLFFEGAWNVLQPKIADGTFVIKNSSEAVALQDKATLTRDEMAKIIGQVTTNWDFAVAKNLAEANLTAAPAEDKGNVFILAPNDGTARSIADAFAADSDVTSFVVTGQDAEKASVQYIIDGKQSMTVLKDVRTLVDDAIAAAVAYLTGGAPEQTNTYNNGTIDVPAKPSVVIAVDKSNVQKEIFDSGYWDAAEFDLTNLEAATAPEAPTTSDICASGETYTITLWHQWSGTYLDAITAAFDNYMAANPCVTIDLSVPEDVANALSVAIPAGEGPDIIGWANDQIGTQALAGNIVDLTTFGIDLPFLEGNFEPAAVAGMQYAGGIWGLPESQEGIALVYNKDLVTEEYLPTDPKDFAALLEKATAFKEATGKSLICNQAFTGTGGGDAYHSAPVFFGFGVPSYVDEEGMAYLDTPEATAAGEWLASLSGVSDAEASYDICLAGLKEGNYGMWWTGPWAVAGIEEAGLNYGITQMGSPFVGIKALMMSKNAVDRGNDAVALDIMKYFTSAEAQKPIALANKTIPAATAALTDPEVAALYAVSEFGKSLNLGIPMASSPYASAQWGPVGQAVVSIWSGAQSAADALAAAQQAIVDAIAQMQ